MHQNPWNKRSGTLLVAAALFALAGCGGDPPSTLPPDTNEGRDAGEVIVDAGRPDAGTRHDGGQAGAVTSLSVVGDPTPNVEFEGTIALQAILVHSETGAVPNQPVSFQIMSGEGSLSQATATTNSFGIARVDYTAGTTTGQVSVIALAQDVSQEDRADWAVFVSAPDRELQAQGSTSMTLPEPQRISLTAKLTQRGRPVAGSKVTFSASRSGLLLDGQAVSSKVATTSLQGIATVEIQPRGITEDERAITVTARADYADPVFFSVTAQQEPPCESDSQCPNGQICNDDGECIPRPACTNDEDCSAGHECLNGNCVPTGAETCSTSATCDPGMYCDTATGRCLSGCDNDGDCAEPLICSANHTCVPPTPQSCTTDDDCVTGYTCAAGRCIPNTSGGGCSDSSECDLGQYCYSATQHCVTGCDSDDRCVEPMNSCDLNSNTCFTKECEYDEDCDNEYGEGVKVCNEFYLCVDAPAVILDVSGEWSNMVQVFHAANALPTGVKDVLEKVDRAFVIASALLGGDGVGDLLDEYLPDWVPNSIIDAIAGAVSDAIGDYLPEWATDVVHIGTDVLRAVQDFEIRSTLDITQPAVAGNPASVSGKDTWQTAVFYWYTADCPPPSQGQPPDECALMQIDLKTSAIQPAPTSFTGQVDGATLRIDTHRVSFKYGKAVRILLEMALKAITGYPSIQTALTGLINCGDVNDWVRQTAASILESLSGLLETFGMTAEEAAAAIDVSSACTSALNQAASLATSGIESLSAEVPIEMKGTATITREPENTSSFADHLVRGKWTGKFGSYEPPAGQSFADWTADR